MNRTDEPKPDERRARVNAAPRRRRFVRRLPIWCVATMLATSCGGATDSTEPGATAASVPPVTTVVTASTEPVGTAAPADLGDAQQELELLIDGDDDLRVVWRGVGFLPPDVIPVGDARSTAAVVWIEDYDEVLTLDSVTEVVDCDDTCVGDITTWAESQLAVGPMITVIGDRICGNCVEASRLSFVTSDADGGFVAMDGDALAAMTGEIDTAYEVMLSFGRSVRVRAEGADWRVVEEREISDCDPVITEYTMYVVTPSGEREQLAQLETSDNSCA